MPVRYSLLPQNRPSGIDFCWLPASVLCGFTLFGKRGFGRVDTLCAESVIYKIKQRPQSRNAHDAVNDSCAHVRGGGEHPVDYVKVEYAHAEPVYRTDNYKYKRDNGYHNFLLIRFELSVRGSKEIMLYPVLKRSADI